MKKLAIFLYVAYSILLVLTISFADGVGKDIINDIKGMMFKNDITDVVLDIDTDDVLIAKEKYSFSYTVLGEYEGDGGIKFESTNNDVLSIVGGYNPLIHAYYYFEGDEIDVDVIVTSTKDKDFEKIITFTVKKLYPEEGQFVANYFVEGGGWNVVSVKEGMEIRPYCGVTDDKYTNQYEFVYDPEYIRYDEERDLYIAIKPTPVEVKLHFTAVYPNGKTVDTKEFSIIPYTEIEDFDEIRVNNEVVEEITIIKNKSFIPRLYKDNITISSKVDISCVGPADVSPTGSGYYCFKTVGDYTMTFTLPNGFSKILIVHVRNIMTVPEVTSSAKIDGHKITFTNSGESVKVDFIYPEDVTFTDPDIVYDGEVAKVTDGWHGFYVYPLNDGEMNVKFIWDDGFDRLEDTYTIEVVKETSMSHYVKKGITFYVSKILGHSTIFAFLALFTLNLFKYIDTDKKVLKATVYVLSVLPTAVLTEVIQSFQPGRYARAADVLIDACGFLVGTVICLLASRGKYKIN